MTEAIQHLTEAADNVLSIVILIIAVWWLDKRNSAATAETKKLSDDRFDQVTKYYVERIEEVKQSQEARIAELRSFYNEAVTRIRERLDECERDRAELHRDVGELRGLQGLSKKSRP